MLYVAGATLGRWLSIVLPIAMPRAAAAMHRANDRKNARLYITNVLMLALRSCLRISLMRVSVRVIVVKLLPIVRNNPITSFPIILQFFKQEIEWAVFLWCIAE